MKNYKIKIVEVHEGIVEVEAENEAEAIDWAVNHAEC